MSLFYKFYFKCFMWIRNITYVMSEQNDFRLFYAYIITYDYNITDISNICFTSYLMQSIMPLV